MLKIYKNPISPWIYADSSLELVLFLPIRKKKEIMLLDVCTSEGPKLKCFAILGLLIEAVINDGIWSQSACYIFYKLRMSEKLLQNYTLFCLSHFRGLKWPITGS